MAALVTGGGTGVGRAIALALADRRAVAVLGRRAGPLEETAAEIKRRGGCALAVPVDVTDDAALAAAVKQVEAGLGPVDVLVNNAGHGGAPAGSVRATSARCARCWPSTWSRRPSSAPSSFPAWWPAAPGTS